MRAACQTFLQTQIEAVTLPGSTIHPYRGSDPVRNLFFDELPLNFLKENDYGAVCLAVTDRSKKFGKLIAKHRTLGELPSYTLTRRRYSREIMFRCLLYGPTDALWGSAAGVGMVDQLGQLLANNKVIAASDESCIRVAPQDAARPWDTDVELHRKLRRPRLAIVRVLFSGGIQTTTNQPIMTDIAINPHLSTP